jgi:hypothetical protein
MDKFLGAQKLKSSDGTLVWDGENNVLYLEDKDTQDRILEIGQTIEGSIAKFSDKIKITDSEGTDLMINGRPTKEAIKGLVTADIFMTNEAFILTDTFTDNDPSSGYISWTEATITCNGITYTITDDNTNSKYLYWFDGDSTFTESNNMLLLNRDWLLFEDFEVVTDWVKSGDASDMATYTTWKTQGAKSGNLTWVHTGGGTATWTKTLTTGIDCTGQRSIKFDFKCVDYSKVTKIQLKVGSDSSNYRLFEVIPYSNEANEVLADIIQTGTDTGTPDWTAIKYFAFIITETASSTIYIDFLRINKERQGFLVAVNLSGTHRVCLGSTVINGGIIEADTLSVISGYLGSVQVGGADNVNGIISVRDAANVEKVLIDNIGINVYDGNYFLQDAESATKYQIGKGNNLLNNHSFELPLNPRKYGVWADGATPVTSIFCLTEETTKRLNNTNKFAQSFKWAGDTDDFCKGVWLKLIRSYPLMLGGNFTIRIETDSGGSPSTTLANANATISIDERYVGGLSFSDPQSQYFFEFATGFNLTNNTTYWIVIAAAGLDAANYYDFKHDNASNSYADGASKYYDGSWHTYTGDFWFGIQKFTNNAATGVEDIWTTNKNWDLTNNVLALTPDYDELNKQLRPEVFKIGFPTWTNKIYMGSPLLDKQAPLCTDKSYIMLGIGGTIVTPEKEYTFSVFAGTEGDDQNTIGVPISVILKIEAFTTNSDTLESLGSHTETTLITNSYSSADETKLIRAKVNYILPALTTYVLVSAYSASTEQIRVDGFQCIEGSYPAIYNAESALWRHIKSEGNNHIDGSISSRMKMENVNGTERALIWKTGTLTPTVNGESDYTLDTGVAKFPTAIIAYGATTTSVSSTWNYIMRSCGITQGATNLSIGTHIYSASSQTAYISWWAVGY